jgi:predicted DNA-binding antitoxin AbrB/MazE fold protein
MTRQLEVIYEDGVLRPLEPLPFKDRQHLKITVSDESDQELGYNPRTKEFEWLRVHGEAHRGKYVGIEADQLVGEGDSVVSVMEQARAKGVPHSLVHYIPDEPELPFAGW